MDPYFLAHPESIRLTAGPFGPRRRRRRQVRPLARLRTLARRGESPAPTTKVVHPARPVTT